MNRKLFIKNSLCMVVTTFILRLTWTAFRVYVSNTVGAECMGLYQLNFTVYNFAVTLAVSGVHFASTRLVAQDFALSRLCKGTMNACIRYSLIFSIPAFIILYFFSESISLYVLLDDRATLGLKALAVSLPFVSLSSCFSGYFFSSRKVYLSMSSRVLEQIIHIASFVILINLIPRHSVEMSYLCVVLSEVVSEIIGSLFLVVVYRICERKNKSENKGNMKRVLKIALPSAAGMYIKTGLQTAENLLVPVSFRKFGASGKGALESYGLLSSMVMPILSFPSFVLSSFSMLLIPEYTESQAKNNLKDIQRITKSVIKATLFFSLVVSSVFVVFGQELGVLLYQNDISGGLVKTMALLVPFMYLDSITDGLLKGLGEYNYVLMVSSIDTIVSIVLIVVLISKYGLYGYVSVIYISTALNTFLSVRRLLKITNTEVNLLYDILIPFSFGISACKLFYNVIGVKGNADMTVAAIFLSVSTIIFLIYAFRKGRYFSEIWDIFNLLNTGKERNINAKHTRIDRKIQG